MHTPYQDIDDHPARSALKIMGRVLLCCLVVVGLGCSEPHTNRDATSAPRVIESVDSAAAESRKMDTHAEHPAQDRKAPEHESVPAAANPDLPAPSPTKKTPAAPDSKDPGVKTKAGERLAQSPSDNRAATPSPAPKVPAGDTDGPSAAGFRLLGETVPPATTRTAQWAASQSFEAINVPVLVVNGKTEGPVLCLTAAVHGDELNGIEVVRRVVHDLDPNKLTGTVIGVPIVNLHGFHRSSRYLPDRRDLNRFFPGNPNGSSASRTAHSLFNHVLRHCDALVDLHTGSFHRTNLPQLRADLTVPDVVDLTKGFGSTVVLHSIGAVGTLRRSATLAGIPTVTFEAGEPLRLQESEVAHGVKAINTLLSVKGMYKKRGFWRTPPEPVYYTSKWIRADVGGILLGDVKLGERVVRGDVLGAITDPITNDKVVILAPYDGRVLGMALNQVVHPGFAAFRLGIDPDAQADPVALTAVADEEPDRENSEE